MDAHFLYRRSSFSIIFIGYAKYWSKLYIWAMLNNYPIFRVIYGLTKRARKFSDNYKLFERNLFLSIRQFFDKHEHLIGSKIMSGKSYVSRQWRKTWRFSFWKSIFIERWKQVNQWTHLTRDRAFDSS